MTLKRLILAFVMSATLATYLFTDDKETIHRSLSSDGDSVVRDPRTVQRKMNQIPPSSVTSNPAPDKQARTSNKVKVDSSLALKPVSPHATNKVKADTSSEIKPISPRATMKVNADDSSEIKPISPQATIKVIANAPLEVKPSSPQATNKVKSDASLQLKLSSPQQQVGNLRQVPVESRRGSETLSIMSRANAGRAMTADQDQSSQGLMTSKLRPLQTSAKNDEHQATNSIQAQVPGALQDNTPKGSTPQVEDVGVRDTKVSVDRATVEQTAIVQPLSPTRTGQSKPVENALAQGVKGDEQEHKEIVLTKQDEVDDEEEDAQGLQKLLRETEPLPGQRKVDELLKAHRGNREADDVSNKDFEKERFFRLMYGRSKPNKAGEY
jgi:hypothetical protein